MWGRQVKVILVEVKIPTVIKVVMVEMTQLKLKNMVTGVTIVVGDLIEVTVNDGIAHLITGVIIVDSGSIVPTTATKRKARINTVVANLITTNTKVCQSSQS